MNIQETSSGFKQVAPCKVIDIGDFGECRKKELEEWLVGRMSEIYGDRSDSTVKNPLLRITTKFDALNKDAQYELYGYVRYAAVGKSGRLSMRKEFWNFLEMAIPAWEDIEKFADSLMYREKAYKQEKCFK